jgi:hypothetical protein
MVVDPKRSLFLMFLGVCVIGALLHIIVISSPRYCDHWGWCATSPTFIPGQPIQYPGR